jgi:hypothetical protein
MQGVLVLGGSRVSQIEKEAKLSQKRMQMCVCRMYCRGSTYGGGGGDDSRRRSRGRGVPLGKDEFLCARNCIVDGRRISSRAGFVPLAACSGLGG